MKLFIKLIGVIVLLTTANSQAALVSVNTSADMTSGLSLATSLLPIGTKVTSDVSFNISTGTISTSNITNVSGTFSWMDSVFGVQTFSANNAFINTINSSGWFDLNFTGNGPTINGITSDNFSILFNVGTNPFVSPGNTTELYDLVVNGSIDKLRIGASQNGLIHYGELESNVIGAISAVPIPSALILFVSGVLGLFATRSRSLKKL